MLMKDQEFTAELLEFSIQCIRSGSPSVALKLRNEVQTNQHLEMDSIFQNNPLSEDEVASIIRIISEKARCDLEEREEHNDDDFYMEKQVMNVWLRYAQKMLA